MSAPPQGPSNGQTSGVDLTLPSTSAHSSTGHESPHAETVGNSSPNDDLVNTPSSFELLRRRTLAQQPYRGMVRTNGCDNY